MGIHPVTGKKFNSADAKPPVKRRGVMNKWERSFSELLEMKKRTGLVTWWAFEPVRIRLADGAYYTPDFAVMDACRNLKLVEVKGHWREAARVRVKVAAEIFPVPIEIWSRQSGQWEHKETFGQQQG